MARSKAGAWSSNIPAARAGHGRGAAAGVTRGRRAALALLAAVGMAWNTPALPAAPPGLGLTALVAVQAPAQAQPRPSRAHVALNTGIECSRRGDYEQAAVLFDQAREGWADLTPPEQEELTRWVQSTGTALQARREGTQQLALAEQALASGRAADAAELLKKVLANQYLAAADKQRAHDLAERARPRAGAASPAGQPMPGGAANAAALSLARSKLQQARAFLAQGNYDAAEQLAHEAEQLNAVYVEGEDHPAKVYEDVYRARTDPKGLLAAARAALKRGDYDRAEALAQMSARADSSWNLHLWGDSPAQVLKEVQAARGRAGTAGVHAPPRTDAAPQPPQAPPDIQKAGMFSPAQNTYSISNKPPATAAPALPPADANAQAARRLLQQARMALQDGNLEMAGQLAARARALAPGMAWGDDSPDKVQADIQRAQAGRPMAAGARAPGLPPVPRDEKLTAEDARAMLHQARQLYSSGDLDHAAWSAQRVKAGASVRWGIFEDSPEKLLQDIDEARAQRDKVESVKVLAQARKLYDQGELDQAAREAYRAQKLHGPYSWWDLGDRPMKLLAEIETARSKSHRQNGPVMADNSGHRGGPTPPADPRAGQMIAEARQALRHGDVARADALARQVTPAGEQDQLQLVSLRQEIASAQSGGPAPNPGPAGTSYAMPAPTPVPNPTAAAPTAPGAAEPARAQAIQLLAECRRLQQQGRLVEARQKALAAQALHVAFAPVEDSPELALLQLSALAYKQVDGLVQRSADLQQAAAGNPANYQQAEQGLLEARSLAVGFGFDTSAVEARLQGLAQQRALAQGTTMPPAGPAGEAHVAGGPAPAAPNGPGQVLLTQARRELRKGDTASARKLANDCYTGPYGLRAEAEALLRSIDMEEFAQQRLAADRTYEAGLSAFRRKDYANAVAILHTLNTKLLDQEKQDRLKNIFALPEMQPGQVAQASAQERPAAAGEGVAHVSDLPSGGAGAAHASDDLLKITQAMQDVKFQQLRQQGLEVQREAADRFRSGDTERAVELLQKYAEDLSTVQLDSDRVALLRRPIESRLLTFRTLKAQHAFEAEVNGGKTKVASVHSKNEMNKQNKEKKVAELMQQYDSFYKDGKYKEAEMYAMAAFELDPDNAAAGAAVKIARIQRRQVDYQHVKDHQENYFVETLNDTEDPGEVVDPKVGVKFDAEHTREILKRRADLGKGIVTPTKGDKEKETDQVLVRPVHLSFKDTPLDQVLEDIRAWHGVNIVADTPALDSEGVSLKHPVSIQLDNVSLHSALDLLLHQVHLTYVNQDGVLVITTEGNARGKMVTTTYQVADLVMPINDAVPSPTQSMTAALERTLHPQSMVPVNGVSPYVGPNALPPGQQASSPYSNSPGMQGATGSSGNWKRSDVATATAEDQLIKLITSTVAPQTWESMGGQGTINYYPLGMALVIHQTPDIQEQIAELLAALRRLQDQEVTIEMRFISVAEGFFERIGVDFNLSVTNNTTNVKYGPLLTTGQFQPVGFINNFQPQHFVSGLTPAGTFTSDLSIPLQTSSFGMAIPPFGAFPNIPGADGGISLGLAFLSDLQVFLFMEAAQGDQRTNVLQAPKLTMANGQTSSISINDQQFFVTNVSVIQQGGQLAFLPSNTPFPTGVNMVLQAVISADRRFVRINFSGVTLTNLASATVPLFPIVTPIIPLFEGGFQANPVLFTQFLQQPVLNQVTITTTATIPDGGTVVLGGLKRLSEGRNEFGPPVLSKIPYINRLFRNQAFGKEVESLLIMVTPRIIINEEEERIQTGVVTTPPP